MSDLKTKLGGGLNILQDSVQQGKQKLQTAQEISQYRKLVQENSERRANLLLQLGEQTSQKIRTGELKDLQLRDYVLKIAELDRQIFQTQSALEQLNRKSDSWACSKCGSQIGVDDKFCGSCGQQQEPIATGNDTVETAVCPTCEEQVPAQGNFCACCGSRLVL
ncbi:zinc ribbon domain-containing protein [Neobacillus soli]|uniref:zinc ribbon domain-containing protein n=1 Tax=Neobacillus soli TaxID=220688 RepID=UPI00082467DF|nr:zinc ribbon domain-containing protein [Neobacillus soli]